MNNSCLPLVCLAWAAPIATAAAQDEHWSHQLGTSAYDSLTSVAADGAGGVFVSGGTGAGLGGPHLGLSDAWIARYDALGNQTWIRQFGTGSSESVFAAKSDGAGGVYLCGESNGSLGGPHAGLSDAWVGRFDGLGNQLWIRQLGSVAVDYAFDVATDGTGGVYVVGATSGDLAGASAGGSDIWLARYDSAGNQSWIRQFGTSRGNSARAAAPDGAGGLYIGGETYDNLGGPHAGLTDAWLARYDGAGNQVWIEQLGTSGGDYLSGAAPDGAGGVHVTGRTTGNLGGSNSGGGDAWLARFDGAGNQVWIRQLVTSCCSSEWAYTASPDGAGGVYIGGSSDGDLAGPNAGGSDAWFARYDGAGTQLWIRQLGSSALDLVAGLATDAFGGCFVGGVTEGSLAGAHAGDRDVWLAHNFDDVTATRYCSPAVSNSTGVPGTLTATGSSAVHFNELTLTAESLPLNQLGYFLVSQSQGSSAGPGGSQGTLCLAGAIGRYNSAAGYAVQDSGSLGRLSLAIDLMSTPTPMGLTAVLAGETWNFQAWYTDFALIPLSNFTDALSITFN